MNNSLVVFVVFVFVFVFLHHWPERVNRDLCLIDEWYQYISSDDDVVGYRLAGWIDIHREDV